MFLKVEVSAGELIDKITILEIKQAHIADPAKRSNIERELQLLSQAAVGELPANPALNALRAELKAINESLWKVEDDIRDHERRQDFGASFVALARAVYHTNDRRSAVKRQINDALGSTLVEEKSYAPY
jgi:hypothetical protein